MMNQPIWGKAKDTANKAKETAKQLALQAKEKAEKYVASDEGQAKIQQGKDMAANGKDLAGQAKTNAVDYIKSDKAKEHLAQAKKLSVSEKAKLVYKSVGAGALAVLISGTGGKMMDANSKANTFKEMDNIAKAELTVSDKAVEVSKNQINNFTQHAGFGEKTIADKLRDSTIKNNNDRIEALDMANTNLQDHNMSQSLIDQNKNLQDTLKRDASTAEYDSRNLTSPGNSLTGKFKQEMNDPNAEDHYKISETTGNDTEVKNNIKLHGMLQDHARTDAENRVATDKYYAGGTKDKVEEMKPIQEAANNDARNAFVVGGLAGGFAFSQLKKKNGEKEPEGDKPEPTPEPTPTNTIDLTKSETGFTTEQYGPQEAPKAEKTEWQESIENIMKEPTPDVTEVVESNVEAPVVEPVIEPKVEPVFSTPEPVTAAVKEVKKPSWFQSFGKTVTQIAMGASLIGGGVKVADQLNKAPEINNVPNPITQISDKKVDISTETYEDAGDGKGGASTPEVAATTTKEVYEAPKTEVPLTKVSEVTATTQEASPAAAETPAAAIPATPEVNLTPPTIAPNAYSADNPDYLAAKAKLDAFAKESGLASQMKEYTSSLAGDMITNMTATLNEKGATMAPAELEVLKAKIASWNYIKTHIPTDSIYIPIADSAKATLEKAATGNPDSVLLKIRYNRLNIADIAKHKFESGTFAGSYADSHGLTDAKANFDKFLSMR